MTLRKLFRGSVLVLALTLSVLFSAESTPSARPNDSSTIAVGAWIPNSEGHPRQLDRFTHEIGRKPVIVSLYPKWSDRPFEGAKLNPIWSRGAVPLVTWEPWDSSGRGIPLQSIAKGRYDGYVRRSAAEAAAWGHPILLRFAHEMNGDWYPWGRRGRNTPQLYTHVWRHVVHLFRESDATNVEWVWSPNVNEEAGPSISLPLIGGGSSHPFPFERYYPGDRWVDWIGLDGFNWGKGGAWQSFTEIFGNSYDSVVRFSSRPIIVSETASNERFGEKATWISSAFEKEIPRFPRIRAVVWFDEAFSGVSARIDSSPEALQAFRSAMASPRYSMTRKELLSTPSVFPHRPAAPSPPGAGFGEPSLPERITHKLHGRYLAFAIGASALLLGVLLTTSLLLRRRRLRARAAR
jgi:Glycosyl hydrolase family 26